MQVDEHLIPVDDLIDHDPHGDTCPCGPRLECVPTPHGDLWLAWHHPLDGRPEGEG